MMSIKQQDLAWNREVLVDAYMDLYQLSTSEAIKRLQDDLTDDLIDSQDVENAKTDADALEKDWTPSDGL
jgi:hypothetical protein